MHIVYLLQKAGYAIFILKWQNLHIYQLKSYRIHRIHLSKYIFKQNKYWTLLSSFCLFLYFNLTRKWIHLSFIWITKQQN